MVKKTIYILALLMLLILSACDKFTAPQRFEGNVYTLAGLLYAGETISGERPIYVTRSSSISEFNPLAIFVTDADVVIKDLGTNEQFTLTCIPDFIEFKYKYIDTNEHVIQPEHTYSIEVTIPGRQQKITAQTTVPFATELITDIYNHGNGYSLSQDTMNELVYNTVDQKYPLTIKTGAFSGAFNFMGEFFCLEEFSTNLEFTTPVFGSEHPDTTLIDAYYAGGESIRRIKFIGRYASQAQPGMEGNYLVVKDYKQAFVFFGRYRVSIYIVDDNYYRYSYMPEGYFHGGVSGGLGYFGSAGGGKMFAKLVK